MAAIPVIGSNPISVLSDEGQQFGFPLSLFTIKQGAIDTSALAPDIVAEATPVLQALYQSKALVAGTVTATEAMTLKAKSPGAAANSISVTFANVVADDTDPENSTTDVTITYEDRREGLTPALTGTELGTPDDGTKPGLVVLTAAATGLPAELLTPTALAAANPGDPLRLAVPAESGGGDAFTLEVVGDDPLLEFLTVAIEDVDTAAGTFTLVIALEHTEAGVELDELDTKLGLLLDVEPGPDGFAPPAAGSVTLKGGTDARTSPPKVAEASIFSN